MDKKEILDDLAWIRHYLDRGSDTSKPEDLFLLEHATRLKPYSASEVHGWAREWKDDGEVTRAYGKIRDLLHIKILSAVASDRLDKGIAQRHLTAFYDYSEKTDTRVKGDIVVKILSEGANL